MFLTALTHTFKRAGVLIAVGAFLLAVAPAAAQDAVGEWDVEMDYQGRNITGKLTIKSDGDSLTGTWSGQRGESELSEVKIEDGKLTFVRVLDFGGQEVFLNFEGKVDGNALTGKFITDFGDMDVTGKRIGADEPEPAEEAEPEAKAEPAAAGAASPVGKWNVEIDMAGSMVPAEITISEEGGDLKGVFSGDQGDLDLSNINYDAGNLKFDLAVDLGGEEMVFSFDGKIAGDKIEGVFASDFGDAAVTGMREGASPAADTAVGISPEVILGEWKTVVESPDGALEGITTWSKDESGAIVGRFVGEDGATETELINVKLEGDQISFTVEGIGIPFEYKGTLKGDVMEGELIMEEGQPGIPTKSTRIGGSGANPLVGTWNLVTDVQGNPVDATFVVSMKDGELVGNWSSEYGDSVVKDLKLDGDKVTFVRSTETVGDLQFEGTLDGGSLSGTLSSEAGDFTTKGTKADTAEDGSDGAEPAADESDAEPAVVGINLAGDWNLEAEMPDGTTAETVLHVSETDGSYSGVLATDFGETKIESVELDGEKITFTTEIDAGGIMVPMSFSGTIKGGVIEGVITVDMDGTALEIPVKGTRAD